MDPAPLTAIEKCRAARAASLAAKKAAKEAAATAAAAPPASEPEPEPPAPAAPAPTPPALATTPEEEEEEDISFVDADELVTMLRAQSETLNALRDEVKTIRERTGDLSSSFARHGVRQEYAVHFV